MTTNEVRILYLLATQEYGGKSALGVRIGDPEDRVESLYGPCPQREASSWVTTWLYPAWGIAFEFKEGRVASWWIFEWAGKERTGFSVKER